jgi:hypothetical protein
VQQDDGSLLVYPGGIFWTEKFYGVVEARLRVALGQGVSLARGVCGNL